MGVRKFICRMELPSDLDAVITIRTMVFLDGVVANVGALLDFAPRKD